MPTRIQLKVVKRKKMLPKVDVPRADGVADDVVPGLERPEPEPRDHKRAVKGKLVPAVADLRGARVIEPISALAIIIRVRGDVGCENREKDHDEHPTLDHDDNGGEDHIDRHKLPVGGQRFGRDLEEPGAQVQLAPVDVEDDRQDGRDREAAIPACGTGRSGSGLHHYYYYYYYYYFGWISTQPDGCVSGCDGAGVVCIGGVNRREWKGREGGGDGGGKGAEKGPLSGSETHAASVLPAAAEPEFQMQ